MRYPLLEAQAKGRPLTELAVQVTFPYETTRRRLTETTIYFDGISEDMIEVFTWGQCATLASALWEHTAWDFASVWSPSGGWQHVGLVHPTSRFVDLWGASTWEEALKREVPGARIEMSSLDELFNVSMMPRSGRVRDFEGMTPLYAEAVLFLAEQILSAPSCAAGLERAA